MPHLHYMSCSWIFSEYFWTSFCLVMPAMVHIMPTGLNYCCKKQVRTTVCMYTNNATIYNCSSTRITPITPYSLFKVWVGWPRNVRGSTAQYWCWMGSVLLGSAQHLPSISVTTPHCFECNTLHAILQNMIFKIDITNRIT